jgi:hypothetical protein
MLASCYRKHLAELSHKLTTRPGRPHIPSEYEHGLQAVFTGGALAQLGERLICIQEVIGSIPLGSTKECGSVAQVVRAHA